MSVPARYAIWLLILAAIPAAQIIASIPARDQVWIITTPTSTTRCDQLRRCWDKADGSTYWEFLDLADGRTKTIACFENRFGKNPRRPPLNPVTYRIEKEPPSP